MNQYKFGTKKTILVILGIATLAFITIFCIYWYYRVSINPNPVTRDDLNIKETIENKEPEESYHLHIDGYKQDGSSVNISSVFDTDLKLQEALANSDKALVFKGELEFTESLQEEYKTAILGALYLNNYKKACDYANEIIKNYDLNSEEFKNYEIFLYEVLELKDYDSKSFQEKKSILEDMLSPELILFMFLKFEGVEQYDILTYKDSDMLFGNAVGRANLTYKSHLSAGIYTEMRLNDAYFVVPDNIDGYKITFDLEQISYRLFYIRYKETNKIEIIKIENLSEDNPVSYKTYFSMYKD